MSNKTKFIRVDKTNNYSVIHNDFLRRKDLSWKAKGIMAYILQLPNDWNINLNEVINHSTDGEKSFRSGWKELKDLGYVKRYPVRNKETKKIDHWETVVHENVDMTTNEPLTQKLHVENQHVGNLHVENDNLLSTNNTKYLNKLNTNKSNVDKESDLYKVIIDYLNDKAGKNFQHSAKQTKKLIKARINEGFSAEDFKTVIDIKTKDWLNDQGMYKYLRPETLFSNKFESYLNEQPKGSKDISTNKGWLEARYE